MSTRLSTRERPPATSSTARCRSSIRPCSETAKSTRSSLPPPSSTRCAARTACSFRHASPATISASPATAQAAIAIHSAVDRFTALAAEREDDLVLRRVVRHPHTLGNSAVHISRFAALVETDRPLPAVATAGALARIERQSAKMWPRLVPDRATLQMGIGAIPDAVLSCLEDRGDLGVHTEMFCDGCWRSLEARRGQQPVQDDLARAAIVTSFALGSQRLYDFVDGNPFVEFHPSDIVNDTREIRRIERMIAINSAVEIDLTGQVVADSIGERIYSGIGGQMDFMRGALAPGGKAIIALPSTARAASFRIVPTIARGRAW